FVAGHPEVGGVDRRVDPVLAETERRLALEELPLVRGDDVALVAGELVDVRHSRVVEALQPRDVVAGRGGGQRLPLRAEGSVEARADEAARRAAGPEGVARGLTIFAGQLVHDSV